MSKTNSVKYLGTCAACGRQIKVRNGKLVHHGYKRPGHGWIQGDCFGVHYPAHETSVECAAQYLGEAQIQLAAARLQLADAPNVKSLMVQMTHGYGEITPESQKWRWEMELKRYTRGIENRIAMIEVEIKRVQPLVTNWTKKELTEVK